MKVKLRKTGEIVDVLWYNGSFIRSHLDAVSYVDSKGVEHDRESLNFHWDFEYIEDTVEEPSDEPSDEHWQELRERAAIAAMQGILANPNLVDGGINYKIEVEKYAIGYADTLIEELKKK